MTWYLWAYVIHMHEFLRYVEGYTNPDEFIDSLLTPNMSQFARWITQL